MSVLIEVLLKAGTMITKEQLQTIIKQIRLLPNIDGSLLQRNCKKRAK